MRQPTLMIYGATGYTGRLVAAEAVESGLRPVLAGRSGERLRSVAGPLGLETRAVSLDAADLLAAALEDITVVLHCAGPFSRTALPMFEACLTAGAHYLDITGEVAVCEALAARDTAAREAGIMVLPGAGFDVVPSDCLIADLAARCPGGRVVRLGVAGGRVVRLGVATRSGASRGTMRTILESVNNFRIRKGGVIERVAPGSLRHEFDFGEGPRSALVSVLADVSTAYRSTGIGNIETYSRAGRRFQAMTRLSRRFGWLLAGRIPQMVLSRLVDRRPEGPGESERRSAYAILVAEIEDATGGRVAARLRTPDPYGLTAKTAVAIAARALRGDVRVGYQTPSSAYGADFIRQFDGVEWPTV